MRRSLAGFATFSIFLVSLVLIAGPCAGAAFAGAAAPTPEDPYLWLEEVDGARALEWVGQISRNTSAEMQAVPEYAAIMARNLEIYNSKERIARPSRRADRLYNFWQDDKHVRGVWRRTTLEGYLGGAPEWETVIDVDALSAADGVEWVWKGASCLEPEHRLCMIALSRGGGDAVVRREFDTKKRRFVKGGFELPEAKSSVAWKDADTLWVGTDFGAGSLTESGYARIVKLWSRGTDLAQARSVFESAFEDISATGYTSYTPEGRYDVVVRTPEFFRQETFLMLGERLVKLDIPEDAEWRSMIRDRVVLSLRDAWTVGGATYPEGSLVSFGLDGFLRGERSIEVLFEPTARISLSGVSRTRNDLIVSTLDNVRGRLYRYSPGDDGGWSREEIPLPGLGTVGISDTSTTDDTWFLTYTDFLTPSSLYVVQQGKPRLVQSLPHFFDTTGMRIAQYEASSADGTKIPYFVVTPSGFRADGKRPTLLYGYGGFEVAQRPYYTATFGTAWLERGGVYVLSNIRGGGEFGPSWHKAALRENRHKSFEDFIAVAEDLIARKITSPQHLGIMGGSNGGLLVGAAMTLRPELFGAVVCTVPLLDMRRYHTLLAGASWMSEYGDPDDPADWAYIREWSPYHTVRADATYPRALFTTSTRDDRVHPGHARKMVAKMVGMGHPVYYYEITEGGHSAGALNEQRARSWAMNFAYLWKMLR